MTDILLEFLDMRETALGVLRGVVPLIALGFLMAALPWVRRHSPAPPGFFIRLLKGGAVVFIGLTLFLQGITIGFIPAGNELGRFLASSAGGYPLIPFGLVLGFFIAAAEPTVTVLCRQVEAVTAGAVPKRLLLITMCVGVSLAVGLGMARLIFGWPILWIILPGYALILILSRFCTSFFAAIAYDASTVVTGPILSSFMVALTLGAAAYLPGRDPLLDGFGLVALVAMVPIMAMMVVGVIINFKACRITHGGSDLEEKDA